MKLSRSVGYAIVAVGHIAQSPPSDPVFAKTIAKEHKIPLDYLLKILQQLVRANILNGIRGPKGGFIVLRPANKITVLDIVEAVDGPFISTPNLGGAKASPSFNQKVASAYTKASREAANILKKTTIASLGNPGRKATRKKK
jgi:Rrf2 family transcriptional regulator, cysteine metabolism repressor